MKPSLYCAMMAIMLSACAAAPLAPAGNLPPPFPTMTLGSRVMVALPTPSPQGAPILSNPATAVAQASLPTATPDYTACPAIADDVRPSLTERLNAGFTPANAISGYLSDGASLTALEAELLASGLWTETATLNATTDLTGEGVPDVIIGVTTPEQGGTLWVLVCDAGRYALRYQSVLGGETPQIVHIGDFNRNAPIDVLFTATDCSVVDGLCQQRSGMFTWDAARGAFVNLLITGLDGDAVPVFGDLDNDAVQEIITQQRGFGNPDSGPIRTGSQVYDWNGDTYVLSVSQPDPIRFRIQIIHEADLALEESRLSAAVSLYQQALNDNELDDWFGEREEETLRAYAYYRLLLAYAYAENDPLNVFNTMAAEFPDAASAPVYAVMGGYFWDAFQQSNSLSAGCDAALAIAAERPEALTLLNRYGTRSPTYTLDRLCAF